MWNCRWFVRSPPSPSVPPWPRPGLSHTQLHIRPEQTSSRMIAQNYGHCFKQVNCLIWLTLSQILQPPGVPVEILRSAQACFDKRSSTREEASEQNSIWLNEIWQDLVDIHFCLLSLSLGWYQFYWCFAHHSYEDQLLLSLPSNFFPGFQNWVAPQQCCNIKGKQCCFHTTTTML